MSTPYPTKVDNLARELTKGLRGIQEERELPTQEVVAGTDAEGAEKKYHRITKTTPRRSLSISSTKAIYRPTILTLKAIVISLGLQEEMQPEELKAIVDKFSYDKAVRLHAIAWQFNTYPDLGKPAGDLIYLMSGPAAENEWRKGYLKGAWKCWSIASKGRETLTEFISKFDNIRKEAIRWIKDGQRSRRVKDYLDYLELKEVESGKWLAARDDTSHN